MTYNSENQFRCTIVRGKSYIDLDNLLSVYASIIESTCPCEESDFEKEFNYKLSEYFDIDVVKKTLDNHRTEVAGKLFGMYFRDDDGYVYSSDRLKKLITDSDQPAFFKELLLLYQFPSGMSKSSTLLKNIESGVGLRQFVFLIKLLKESYDRKVTLTKTEIGYYVLNNLDALSGRASIEEILEKIQEDRSNNIERRITNPGKAHSYNYQHINEQINLLILANIVKINQDLVFLNMQESKFINFVLTLNHSQLNFDFSRFDLSTVTGRHRAQISWDKYFASLTSIDSSLFYTSIDSLKETNIQLVDVADKPKNSPNNNEIGDEGEAYVYNYEIQRISKINPRLTNRIKLFGKIRGLGYDIHSIYGVGQNAEFVKYIEVKSTKRVTAPSDDYIDSINLTRNEWMAAQQHGQNYHIYRLYFTNLGVKMLVILNPFNLSERNLLNIQPTTYRAEFNIDCGKFINE